MTTILAKMYFFDPTIERQRLNAGRRRGIEPMRRMESTLELPSGCRVDTRDNCELDCARPCPGRVLS